MPCLLNHQVILNRVRKKTDFVFIWKWFCGVNLVIGELSKIVRSCWETLPSSCQWSCVSAKEIFLQERINSLMIFKFFARFCPEISSEYLEWGDSTWDCLIYFTCTWYCWASCSTLVYTVQISLPLIKNR